MRSATRAAVLLVAWTVVAPPPDLAAQPDSQPIIAGTSAQFDSRVLDETREILVHRPADYDQADTKYPVLYLLGAEYRFAYVIGIVDFLSSIGHIPDLIVVGITNTDRNRDLTPAPGEEQRARFPTSGGADRFLRFLREEIIPYIDSTYRTEPYRILVGHSLGGLFTVHTLLTTPGVFQAFIASSPSLYWNNQFERSTAEATLGQRNPAPSWLFMTIGNEREEMVESAKGFAATLEQHAPADVSWHFDYLPDEGHSTSAFVSVYPGLEFVFSESHQLGDLDSRHSTEHYNQLVRRYGYAITLPLGILYDSLRFCAGDHLGR